MAADAGDLEFVRRLLQAGAEIDAQLSSLKNSALHDAVEEGHRHVAEALIDAGANLELLDYQGQTPLMTAVCWHRFGMLDRLIGAGANVNDADAAADKHHSCWPASCTNWKPSRSCWSPVPIQT